MIKKILSVVLMATALTVTAQAQQKVHLAKGDKTVATYSLSDGDYICFSRPANMVTEKKVELTETETGKNYVSYTVATNTVEQVFAHMLIKCSYIDLFLTQYYGLSIETATEDQMKSVFRSLFLSGYGYVADAAGTFTFKDGEEDGNGETLFIPGGQDYYIVTVDVNVSGSKYTMGNELSYTKVSTKTAEESSETLTVTYDGLNANGAAQFSITPSAGIATMHTVFGTTASIDEFINVYSYDYLMFTQGESFTNEQWYALDESNKAWSVSKEGDYSLYVLGIDQNGDWVKAQVDTHIKPLRTDSCPELDVTSSSVSNGNVSATISVSPQTLTKATVRLMLDDDFADEVNGYTYDKPSDVWPDVAMAGDAEDITEEVNANGMYTFTKEGLSRGWYALLFTATDKNGTTVTKAVFHTHLTDANWEYTTKTYPATSTSEASAKSFAPATGKVSVSLPKAGVDTIAPKYLK